MKAYAAERIFTGESWLIDHAILVDAAIIIDILPTSFLRSGIPVQGFPDNFIAPAFIDLQIYGGNGRLLSAYPEVDSLYRLRDYCRSGGAAFCIPTIATNTREVFYQCIDTVRDYWKEGGEGILGLHLEGPWINTSKRGAHIESMIHSPTIAEVEEMLNYGKGVIRIITLAPECCSEEVIQFIQSRDISISAGHTNASYEEAIKAFDGGIGLVTHLYNAMSPLSHRAPGMVGATLDNQKVMASIIPDGHHVDFAAIRIAKNLMKERLFVITDAVTETDRGPYQHQLEGDKYVSSGILSGSALTMIKAVHNLVIYAGVALEEALRMCSLYPARAIKMDNSIGKLIKGYSAQLVVLDEKLKTAQLIS